MKWVCDQHKFSMALSNIPLIVDVLVELYTTVILFESNIIPLDFQLSSLCGNWKESCEKKSIYK